jgi:peptidoglycan/LPS O-acetylase OafA/YrhL
MNRVQELDAVRGVAVLLVLVHNTCVVSPSLHLGLLVSNGWMGVDLFFVLSGFLITGVLLETKKSRGYFRRFYARRCLRIWPLYYSVLFVMFVMVPFIRPSEAQTVFNARSSPWWSYLLFVQNFLVPVPTMATGLLAVTWSLAIEEQFYLVWPFVVHVCNEADLRKIVLGAICISPLLRLYLSLHGVNIYSNTFCRLDALSAGACLALVIRSNGFVPSRFVMRAWVALVISVPVALLGEVLHARWVGFSFVALAAVSFVYLALFSKATWLRALLTNRFLVYTGTISYGIYLLEKIPVDVAKSFHLDKHQFLAFPITVVATYAMAALSWRFLESPFLALKAFFDETTTCHAQSGDSVVEVVYK